MLVWGWVWVLVRANEDGGRSAEWKSEDFQISIEEERGRDFKIQKERLQFYPFRRG